MSRGAAPAPLDPGGVTDVKVGLDFGDGPVPVGRLALGEGGIYFQYDSEFIEGGLQISPVRLRLRPDVLPPDAKCPFEDHLPGVFNDSLPDIWGRRLLDRLVHSRGGNPEALTPLDRLAHVGAHGMGALVYEPDLGVQSGNRGGNRGGKAGGGGHSLDVLAAEAERILMGDASDILDELAADAASPGGAQPKKLVAIDERSGEVVTSVRAAPPGHAVWMVKFPTGLTGYDAGAVEYAYSRMALDAGVEMAETRLIGAAAHPGYFGTRLFDRGPGVRHHLHSVCGLLHSRFEVPTLDYEDLVTLTYSLTRDIREVEKLFRIAVFNVLAHNRDDHSKNFAFLMDREGRWSLAPAYDLTYAIGPEGEHKMAVSGVGREPGRADLLRLGEMARLDARMVAETIERTLESVSRWPDVAGECGVGTALIGEIGAALERVRRY